MKNQTPVQVLESLKVGNQRFVQNLSINHDLLKQVNETKEGQSPTAIILSCMDSRTSAELIFNLGLGDIFSVRIAGNVVNTDIIGSMEYACKAVGTKLIVILGHTKCGAIKGACDCIDLGNLTELLAKIGPAVVQEKETTTNRTSSNDEFVNNVAEINVHNSIRNIISRSATLSAMLSNGEIGIVGGMYHLDTGVVDFFEENIL